MLELRPKSRPLGPHAHFMTDIPTSSAYLIRGVTQRGESFRPSDWADRLAGAFSILDPDHRICYSPYVQPTTLNGTRCVVVDKRLKTEDPHAYRFLQNFAKSNDLVTENAD